MRQSRDTAGRATGAAGVRAQAPPSAGRCAVTPSAASSREKRALIWPLAIALW